jgi:2',3'-cyclic-nucleotide 2'-phosphodiesterase (5'-nucleotidase family)
MFTALARRAPTILNVGNHEPEFYDLAETVARVQATGVTVISNIVNHATGKPYAPESVRLNLGRATATIVGVTTDRLSTYRFAVRPSLDLANPVVWARQNFPGLLNRAALSIVMSHAGLNADREMLPLVPDGTLFAGAHDHQRFIYPVGRGVYVHSGSWNEYLTLAWLRHNSEGAPVWTAEQVRIPVDGPADVSLGNLINETRLKHLTPEDTVIVGQSAVAMAPADAARFVVRLLRKSLAVDAAFVGNTTFGAGLPAGAISRVEFDACVRFDGTIFIAEIDGGRLQQLMAKANQGPEEVFEKRIGEFLMASGPEQIDPAKHYRIATTDWGARNTHAYFGEPSIGWQEQPGAKFKARVLEGMPAP